MVTNQFPLEEYATQFTPFVPPLLDRKRYGLIAIVLSELGRAHDKSAVIVLRLKGSYHYSHKLTWEMCRNYHNSLLSDVIDILMVQQEMGKLATVQVWV